MRLGVEEVRLFLLDGFKRVLTSFWTTVSEIFRTDEKLWYSSDSSEGGDL